MTRTKQTNFYNFNKSFFVNTALVKYLVENPLSDIDYSHPSLAFKGRKCGRFKTNDKNGFYLIAPGYSKESPLKLSLFDLQVFNSIINRCFGRILFNKRNGLKNEAFEVSVADITKDVYLLTPKEKVNTYTKRPIEESINKLLNISYISKEALKHNAAGDIYFNISTNDWFPNYLLNLLYKEKEKVNAPISSKGISYGTVLNQPNEFNEIMNDEFKNNYKLLPAKITKKGLAKVLTIDLNEFIFLVDNDINIHSVYNNYRKALIECKGIFLSNKIDKTLIAVYTMQRVAEIENAINFKEKNKPNDVLNVKNIIKTCSSDFKKRAYYNYRTIIECTLSALIIESENVANELKKADVNELMIVAMPMIKDYQTLYSYGGEDNIKIQIYC